jgi:hypothetical protein
MVAAATALPDSPEKVELLDAVQKGQCLAGLADFSEPAGIQ